MPEHGTDYWLHVISLRTLVGTTYRLYLSEICVLQSSTNELFILYFLISIDEPACNAFCIWGGGIVTCQALCTWVLSFMFVSTLWDFSTPHIQSFRIRSIHKDSWAHGYRRRQRRYQLKSKDKVHVYSGHGTGISQLVPSAADVCFLGELGMSVIIDFNHYANPQKTLLSQLFQFLLVCMTIKTITLIPCSFHGDPSEVNQQYCKRRQRPRERTNPKQESAKPPPQPPLLLENYYIKSISTSISHPSHWYEWEYPNFQVCTHKTQSIPMGYLLMEMELKDWLIWLGMISSFVCQISVQ